MIRQYDVRRNIDKATVGRIPYFVVLQSDLLDGLYTTIVAPLIRSGDRTTISKINPQVRVAGKEYFVSVPALAGISNQQLGPVVANLGGDHSKFIAAIDLLFTGF